jgi:hypothetical protein
MVEVSISNLSFCIPAIVQFFSFYRIVQNTAKLVVVGIFSVVYLLGDRMVSKLPRTDDAFSLPGNLEAIHKEAQSTYY